MKWLCKIGIHNWKPIPETIKFTDWYTQQADCICTRCKKEQVCTSELW